MGRSEKTGNEKFEVSPEHTKVCVLCGTLNHCLNGECFTCGWRGQFSRDPATVAFAWQHLASRHEGVRLEHLTAQRGSVINELGATKRMNGWQCLQCGIKHWWQGRLAGRATGASEREQVR